LCFAQQQIKGKSKFPPDLPIGELLPVEKSDSEGVSSHWAGAKVKYSDILEELKSLSNPKAVEGMAKYGITPEKTYGVSIPNLRKIARLRMLVAFAQQLFANPSSRVV